MDLFQFFSPLQYALPVLNQGTEPVFLNIYGARNRFQGMNSASLCSLAGRYDNPIPTRFLAHIDCLKIEIQIVYSIVSDIRRGKEKSPSQKMVLFGVQRATYTEVLIVVLLGFFPLIISDLKGSNFEDSSQVCNSFLPFFKKQNYTPPLTVQK